MCDDSWWLSTSTLFCVKNDFDHNKSFLRSFFSIGCVIICCYGLQLCGTFEIGGTFPFSDSTASFWRDFGHRISSDFSWGSPLCNLGCNCSCLENVLKIEKKSHVKQISWQKKGEKIRVHRINADSYKWASNRESLVFFHNL